MSKVEKPYALVVDDNRETCTLLTAMLQREFVVEIANDGQDAVEKLKTRQYAVILLDLRMPHYDGFSVLDYLKEHNAETLRSVIVLTALVNARDVNRAREYNVAGVIAKPFDVEAVLAAVRKCAGLEGPSLGGVFCAPVIMLLADLLRQRLM